MTHAQDHPGYDGTLFASFIEELEARSRIEDVIKRYCRGIDRNRYALALSAYHEGGLDNHGSANGTATEFIASSRARHEHMEHSLHAVTNVQIDFITRTHAVVESYLLSYQRFSATTTVRSGGGEVVQGEAGTRTLRLARYIDVMHHRDGRWGITERTACYGDEFVEPTSTAAAFPAGYEVQRMDDFDLLWRVLERERLRNPSDSSDQEQSAAHHIAVTHLK